ELRLQPGLAPHGERLGQILRGGFRGTDPHPGLLRRLAGCDVRAGVRDVHQRHHSPDGQRVFAHLSAVETGRKSDPGRPVLPELAVSPVIRPHRSGVDQKERSVMRLNVLYGFVGAVLLLTSSPARAQNVHDTVTPKEPIDLKIKDRVIATVKPKEILTVEKVQDDWLWVATA